LFNKKAGQPWAILAQARLTYIGWPPTRGLSIDYSVAFASEVDSWRGAKRAEEIGYSSAWFYDTQMLNPGVFICMALAAHETSHIRLGTGFTAPRTMGLGAMPRGKNQRYVERLQQRLCGDMIERDFEGQQPAGAFIC